MVVPYSPKGSGYAYGYAVKVDTLGDVYVAGEVYNPTTGIDMYVIKYDPAGTPLWSNIETLPDTESAYALSSFGSYVYVTGRTHQVGLNENTDIFIQGDDRQVRNGIQREVRDIKVLDTFLRNGFQEMCMPRYQGSVIPQWRNV